ncbi:hypothetical protein QCE73_35225 [Caballeronia sp. LZ029]|uniref:hypothetical protein n=1 Tax=Caballeronia sp. LZ029 TaxID=3038564 RepID=UPI00286436A1|nr:hypothetical protein [Caballeronia sp. LZ029]MDR5748447.1 hypothetical protein [Caballeronia sp. LZ029]
MGEVGPNVGNPPFVNTRDENGNVRPDIILTGFRKFEGQIGNSDYGIDAIAFGLSFHQRENLGDQFGIAKAQSIE